ncbi:MAG: iron ABC transporter permease [Candidatus Methanomethylophilaceae archaeon]|nr:iron ABC transporter permease [Candidatus Methanomethylophilaceae archaeon]
MSETTAGSRLRKIYDASSTRKRLFITVTAVLVILAGLISVSIGAVDIPLADTLRVFLHPVVPFLVDSPSMDWYPDIILNSRLSRTLLCIICGFSLAVAGAVMQNILRNPLVSPFTLGLSSAASFGAAVGVMFGAGITGSVMVLGHEFFMKNLFIAALAIGASLCSVSLVILLSRRGGISRSTIILTGVIISYLFQAGISAIKYFSNDDVLREITLWLMGGMWNATWGVVMLVLPVVVTCSVAIESMASKVNVLAAGDDVAESLGIDVSRLRTVLMVLSTVVTSVCIAFTGIIGFIGLIAPHVTRMLIGNDSRYLFIASGALGALILSVSDTVSRMVIRPEEIPVGIIMYLAGGIFFIWLVSGRRKEVSL